MDSLELFLASEGSNPPSCYLGLAGVLFTTGTQKEAEYDMIFGGQSLLSIRRGRQPYACNHTCSLCRVCSNVGAKIEQDALWGGIEGHRTGGPLQGGWFELGYQAGPAQDPHEAAS